MAHRENDNGNCVLQPAHRPVSYLAIIPALILYDLRTVKIEVRNQIKGKSALARVLLAFGRIKFDLNLIVVTKK